MTTISPPLSSGGAGGTTSFQSEQHRFGELLRRLIDAILNSLFDLRPQVATIRLFFLVFLFLLSGFLITLRYYPLYLWTDQIQEIFGYLFIPNYPITSADPIAQFITFAWGAFTDPRVLQYLPIFLAPFFIALQTAANYLADVFELADPGVARHFVWAVALTGSNETIRISQGNVYEGSKNSPTLLIGGPGRVVVDLDSAALFEKPDGTPRVIGPTGKRSGGKARLDGFERFRQAVDLRNHVIELRDEEGRSSEILGRSLDGIPIKATDVNFLFTVYRGDQKPTTENPFPFSEEAVKNLVYKAASRVTPDRDYPSSFDFNWIFGMMSLIRSRLGGFMNDHRLTEYIASIGLVEGNQFNKGEDDMAEAVKSLTGESDQDLPKTSKIDQVPSFTPRDRIKQELFNLYADDFSRVQRERGVQLSWMGLGTWRVPVEILPETRIVPEHHLEAWRISHENIVKESNINNGAYKIEAMIQKFVSLIQELPVAKPVGVASEEERTEAMKALLDAYRLQLIQTAEYERRKGKPARAVIIRAIKCLSKALGKPWSWDGQVEQDAPIDRGPAPGGPGSPGFGSTSSGRPSSTDEASAWQRSEEALYNELILLVYGDRAQADRLIDLEQKNFPKESHRQWIIRARDRLLRDRGASTD